MLVAHTVSGDYICSGIGNTDQLSVKDSGKGDSDFNDSDSDISGDGGKKNFITFQPRPSEFLLIFFLKNILTFHTTELNTVIQLFQIQQFLILIFF